MDCYRYCLLVTAIALTIAQNSETYSADPSIAGTLESCRAIPDNAARLRCFENATPNPAQPAPISPRALDGWRLVRTPRPDGGGDVLSMMRTADMLRSDPDLAGMTLRCGQNGLEVLIIVIQPFPPRSRPQVTIGTVSQEFRFETSVIPPGAAILLPNDAASLANGPWQSLKELPIKVEQGETTIRGIVPLSGLTAAVQSLMTSCLPR